MKSLAETIKERRQQLRLTQRELAEHLDVGPNMISTLESGVSGLSEDKMVDLAHRLGMDPTEVLLWHRSESGKKNARPHYYTALQVYRSQVGKRLSDGEEAEK